MSIYRRFFEENEPSFITTNTMERRPVFASPTACKLLAEVIYQARSEKGFRLLAFAIMPDHLHLIIVPAADVLGRTVQLVKGRFARLHNQAAGRNGSVWQNRYHERTLPSEAALFSAIDYVHNNPVAAGLASKPEDYVWSTANGRFTSDLEEYFGQAKA